MTLEEQYLKFALSQHGQKLDEETAKRMTIISNEVAGLANYFLDYNTPDQRMIMGTQQINFETVYFDSMKCRIYLK